MDASGLSLRETSVERPIESAVDGSVEPATRASADTAAQSSGEISRDLHGFCAVPDELLEPVAREDVPGIDRDEAALVVDRYLCRLSRQEAACRLGLGRLAHGLLRSRGYHRLGFARLADYATERLGVSARELQSWAQVWGKVEELPALGRAFGSGRLNWTKLRLIGAAATDDRSAEQWIAVAEKHTSHELEQMLKAGRDPLDPDDAAERALENEAAPADRKDPALTGRSAADRSVVVGAGEEGPDQIDGEPCMRLRMVCPARVRSLWRAVHELASRSSGSVLAQWQALELVAAEAATSVDLGRAELARDETADGNGSGHGSLETGRWTSLVERDQEARTREICYDDPEDLAELRRRLPPAGASADFLADLQAILPWMAGGRLPGSDDPGSFATLWARPPVGSATGAEAPAGDGCPRDGVCSPGEQGPAHLDRELRALLGTMQSIDWQMGCLLATFTRLRLYRNAGFPSMAEYVTERLGISARKARGLVQIEGERSGGRAELATAYRAGQISWVQALILLPMVSERYARAWIERAGKVTVRRLADEVRWAADLRDRTDHTIDMAPPPLGDALDRSDAEAERQIRARFDEQTAARILGKTPTFEVALCFFGPASVIALFCDVLAAYSRPREASWRGFERMLLEAKAVWEAVPRHTNPIHERDGWRCRVPACSSRRNLQEHHLLFRSQGGGNGRENRVSICAWHHLRGIHRGIVRAHGDARGEIRWRLGVGLAPQGEAFLDLRNDIYVR